MGFKKAEDIYHTIFDKGRSKDENIPSHIIAMQMAQEKIDKAHQS